MLYVKMRGRLGNQLFRYAVARAYQKRYCPDQELILDWTIIDRRFRKDASFARTLEEFRLPPHQSVSDLQSAGGSLGTSSFQLSRLQALALKLFEKKRQQQLPSFGNGVQGEMLRMRFRKRWSMLLERFGIYIFDVKKWNSFWTHQYFDFMFENPRYFEEIRPILLEELVPKSDIPMKNRPLYQVIEQNNSVCVSIRRGDFESNPEIRDIHSVCDVTYFVQAIEIMAGRLENPVFIFFSDEIEWVREHIQVDYPTYYEDGTDSVGEKLRMMSSCKHFIISNSSFSWWAQWLSTYEEKIVISPSRWYNKSLTTDLISDEFVTIEV